MDSSAHSLLGRPHSGQPKVQPTRIADGTVDRSTTAFVRRRIVRIGRAAKSVRSPTGQEPTNVDQT
jgi:hypothetical protein